MVVVGWRSVPSKAHSTRADAQAPAFSGAVRARLLLISDVILSQPVYCYSDEDYPATGKVNSLRALTFCDNNKFSLILIAILNK